MSIRLVPVLDLKAGRAVHARGGQRADYPPLQGVLHASSDPVEVARAYRDRLGARQLYLADLDAITGAAPATAIYQSIQALGIQLWVDAGLRDATGLPPLLDARVETIVVGLETVRGPSALAAVLRRCGPERIVFSLDLDDGRPRLAPDADWGTTDVLAIAARAVAAGLRRPLVLDLGRVGTGRGVGMRPLLRTLARARPPLEISYGGGISGRDDLDALERLGVSAALVGSALHDGRIGPD